MPLLTPTTLALLEWSVDWSAAMRPFTGDWWQATICSILVGIACGVLGAFVVLRRMALIGDALSHAVLPGVVIAFAVTGSTQIPHLLLGALAAGVIAAVLMKLVSSHSRTKDDSAIGIVFTAFFALGVILVSALERGHHFDLSCFLFGDPLAVGTSDLVVMAIIAPIVVLVIALLYHPLKLVSFDPIVAAAMGLPVAFFHYLLMGLLSATVVAGLKTTGVVLVVAMLITPASAAYQLTNRLSVMLLLSGLFGAISAALGMSVAFIFNAPTGPAMVIVASCIFVVAMVFSPTHGIVFERLRRTRLKRHFLIEDLLKRVYQLSQAGRCDTHSLAERLALPEPRVKKLVQQLSNLGYIQHDRSALTLTEAGEQRAVAMVRAHRLWETYLADRTEVDFAALHDEAERLEHAHELTDELDHLLGQPTTDPHGSTIPTASV